MRELMAITKALSDENRTRILAFLRGGELCVCKIIEVLELAPSTVSKHLNILNQAGLVDSRKVGRWVYYRLPGRDGRPAAREAIRWVHRALANDPQALQDCQRLDEVNRMSTEELCCRYKS